MVGSLAQGLSGLRKPLRSMQKIAVPPIDRRPQKTRGVVLGFLANMGGSGAHSEPSLQGAQEAPPPRPDRGFP